MFRPGDIVSYYDEDGVVGGRVASVFDRTSGGVQIALHPCCNTSRYCWDFWGGSKFPTYVDMSVTDVTLVSKAFSLNLPDWW